MHQKTFAILKPDSVQRKLTGRIISRIEDKGYKIAAMKMIHMDEETASRLYAIHKGKFFYDTLMKFMTSSPCIVMILEGENVINEYRKMMGSTNPQDAAPGTIRGDFGIRAERNLVHGSDSEKSAKYEIGIFFTEEDISKYSPDMHKWMYV
ncbi:MAG: nucleoside-diphosphate kinase [Armatimonadota bacterium]